MNFIHKIKIYILKRRARAAYLRYKDAINCIDCGHSVAMQFPSVSMPATEFDDIMDQLDRLDHGNVPIQRLTRSIG